MRAFISPKKSCEERLAEVFTSKCKDQKLTDCYTTITVSNIIECDKANFPDKEKMKQTLRKLKGLDRAAYVSVDTTESNFPYLAIRMCAYE